VLDIIYTTKKDKDLQMSETIEQIETCVETLDKSKSYFYANVDEHFVSLKEMKFDQITASFYGSARIGFQVLKGFTPGGTKTLESKYSLYVRQVETNLFNSYEEAIDFLYLSLVNLYISEDTKKCQKDILMDTVNKRFGAVIANYHFTQLSETK